MNLVFNYLKSIIAAVGATVFPPIFNWLVTFIPGSPPESVQVALSLLLTAICTGGAVALTSNQNQPKLQVNEAVVNKANIPPGTPIVTEHK